MKRNTPTDSLEIPYVVTQSYFATVKWDEAFFWALVLLITYLCGIVQSARDDALPAFPQDNHNINFDSDRV